MPKIIPIDVSRYMFDVHRDLGYRPGTQTRAAGEACIVPRGEWHLVKVLEPTQLVHITPGPNGDHRPL